MEASVLYKEVQNSVLQVGSAVDVENASRLSRMIIRVFVEDLEFAVEQNLHLQLWKIIRSLIDTVSGNKETAKSNDNALNMAVSWLTQLSLQLHLSYRLRPNNLLSVLSLTSAVTDSTEGGTVSDATKKAILSFIALRMGDLMRYKNELGIAERLYHSALDIAPEMGDTWNQLGVLGRLRGNMCDAIYYGTRALHSPTPFPSASTNISTILRKFSSVEDVAVTSPSNDMFLVVLARLHFMNLVSDELISRMGPLLPKVSYLVPLLSIYSSLGATDDENEVRGQIEQLFRLCLASVAEKIESGATDASLLSCLSLLVRVPSVRQTNEQLGSRLDDLSSEVNDNDHLQFFLWVSGGPFGLPCYYQPSGSCLVMPVAKQTRSGAREASPAYCAGRAPPPLSKRGSIFQYLYRQMATLVASASGGGGGESSQAAPTEPADSQRCAETAAMQPERLGSADEIVAFLMEHIVSEEPILSSLDISDRKELRQMLADVVNDCCSCSSSCCLRDEQGRLLGVCLASRPTLFEKQMDRLCSYEFQDKGMVIAAEFLKYLFNRVDLPFHCEEKSIAKPVFIMLVAVRPDACRQGCAKMLLDYCISAASEDKCDGAIALCSGQISYKLMSPRFTESVCRIFYQSYRGLYSKPPICPTDPKNDSLHVLLTRLS